MAENENDGLTATFDLLTVAELVDEPTIYAFGVDAVQALYNRLIREYGREELEKISREISYHIGIATESYIATQSAALITQINQTTKKKLQQQLKIGINAGDSLEVLAARVQTVYRQAKEARAKMIAQTESTMIAGYSSYTAIEQAGYDHSVWLTVLDGHARDTHATLNGKLNDDKGYFHSTSGDKAKYPGGFTTAEENVNCRCAIRAAIPGVDIKAAAMPGDWYVKEARRAKMEPEIATVMRIFFGKQERLVVGTILTIRRNFR